MIRIINNRYYGHIFHYAHFLIDCLFPEIVNDVYLYKNVIRLKTNMQTIGNFSKIYTDVMMNIHTELLISDFVDSQVPLFIYKNKEDYCDKIYFDKFINFIFKRYNIISNSLYPEIILIKRGDRINLIDDEFLKSKVKNITTGKERREIDRIDELDLYLKNKYDDRFKSLYLESIEFEEQINYFYNAKLIIGVHGAGIFNSFFCKEGTKLIEITDVWDGTFLDTITKINNIQHIKCYENNLCEIIKCIDVHSI